MKAMISELFDRIIHEERGQVLALAIIMVLLGGLMIPPILQFVADASKSTIRYHDAEMDIYSADAGIEHAMWMIKNKSDGTKAEMVTMWQGPTDNGNADNDPPSDIDDDPPFDPFNYDASWDYWLDEQVNGLDVRITIEAEWMPDIVRQAGDPSPQSIAESGTIIVMDEAGGTPVFSTLEEELCMPDLPGTPCFCSGTGIYQIKIICDGNWIDELQIAEIGVWMPMGYTYAGTSTLANAPNAATKAYYYPSPQYKAFGGGGQYVTWGDPFDQDIWATLDVVNFGSLPGVNPLAGGDYQFIMEFNYGFNNISKAESYSPPFIPWIKCADRDPGTDPDIMSQIPYAWDADLHIFHITSEAGGATIDAWTAKTKARKMGDEILGDYVALGNSLMEDSNGNKCRTPLAGIGHQQDSESESWLREVDLPDADGDDPSDDIVWEDMEISSAYLYWAGWFKDPSLCPDNIVPIMSSTCDNFTFWAPGSDWITDASGPTPRRFRAHDPGCNAWTTFVNDNCSNFTDDATDPLDVKWINNVDWDISSDKFRGHNNGGEGSMVVQELYDDCTDFTGNPGWLGDFTWWKVDAGRFAGHNWGAPVPITLFSDNCSDFDNWDRIDSGGNPNTTEWSIYNYNFLGEDHEQNGNKTYLEMKPSAAVDTQGASSVTVSCEYWEYGVLEGSGSSYEDKLEYSLYRSDGTWGSWVQIFSDDVGDWAHTFSVTTSAPEYLHPDFRIRFRLGIPIGGWYGSDEYCVINNVKIEVPAPPSTGNRDLYMAPASVLNLGSYPYVTLSWDQSEAGELEAADCLRYALYSTTTSDWIDQGNAFCNDSPGGFSVIINDHQYLEQFRLKVWLAAAAWESSYEYCYIDNIRVTRPAGDPVYLEIAAPGVDLSGVTTDILVSWEQTEAERLESTDCLKVFFYDNLGNWDEVTNTASGIGFCGELTATLNAMYVIGAHTGDDQYRHSDFRVRFRIQDFAALGEYVYIDNFVIKTCTTPSPDEDKYLTLSANLDLSEFQGTDVSLVWDHDEVDTLEADDRLVFYLSNDGGSTWSGAVTAFSDDLASHPDSYAYAIPDEYLTSQFRLRLKIEGFGDTGEYCYVDNIMIARLFDDADGRCKFAIDNGDGTGYRWVYWENGSPSYSLTKAAAQKINADAYGTFTESSSSWLYGSFADVTELVKANFDPQTDPSPIKFKVSDVYAYDNADDSQAVFAAWSLVIIFQSPQTLGHKLYIYDPVNVGVFSTDDYEYYSDGCKTHGENYTGLEVLKTVGGFLVPEPVDNDHNGVPDEDYVARVTVMCGEGDPWFGEGNNCVINYCDGCPSHTYQGYAYAEFQGQAVSSVESNADVYSNPAAPIKDYDWHHGNIWDSNENYAHTAGLPWTVYSGVDIDNFEIGWTQTNEDTGELLLEPGDTSATFSVGGHGEVVYMIYTILSFRSEINTGGALNYLIR